MLCHVSHSEPGLPIGAHGEFSYNISMKFAVNWFHNVNLALYSNRIVLDRCLVHGCSNRSDMNAGISAHFSPTIKSERDTWLSFVHSPCELKFERNKVCGGCVQSISQRNVFQERFTWNAVVVGLFLAQFLQYGRSSQGNNLPNDNTVR